MKSRPYINDFATRSFRDLADQDYIAARIAYRNELDQQFLWNSLQAVEKYLKAILLYNGRSSKGIKHDIVKGLELVSAIGDIQFGLPDDVISYIRYLNNYGANRYLVHPTQLRDDALLQLDRTVWHIRRYCYYMRGVLRSRDGSMINMLEYETKKIHLPLYQEQPHKYKIFGGYLEILIKNESVAAQQLVWKNFYFGRSNKKVIRNFTCRSSSANPIHYLHPEIFWELEKLVDFPKNLKEYFHSSR
jgi:HEPN domain-containing protein